MIKILMLAANPTDTTRLRLDAEVREIDNALRQTDFRDDFILEKHFAVRVMDLQGLLLRHKPNIVHFSGHGNANSEILVEDAYGASQPISINAVGQLFEILGSNIDCVVLNACYSENQARAIVQHVNCVVGMSSSIGDVSAIKFSSAFYQALGYGKDIKTAFELGCLQINLDGLGEEKTPKLLTRDTINPSDIILLRGKERISENIPFSRSYESYVNAIRTLLNATFRDAAQFDQFCQKHFAVKLDENVPLTWQFEILIKHCQEHQQLNKLLLEVEEFDKQQYKKYIHSLKKASKRRTVKEHVVKMVRAEFSFPFQIDDFTPEMQAAAINAIAHRLNIPAREIKVIDIHPGSIKIIFELPSDALDKTISMYENDRLALLKDMGISYVMEILDQPYSLENIKSMFVKEYTREMLVDFCNKNFGSVLGNLSTANEAEAIISNLIEYALQKNEIPDLLVVAQKYNSAAYHKHHPYYKNLRRPSPKTAHAPIASEKMSRKELLVAVRSGFILAVFGSMLLSFVEIVIDSLPVWSPITYFMFGVAFNYASFYLGEKVGEQILLSAKNKYDPNLGKMAIACYLIGFISGYTFPYFAIEFSKVSDNKLVWLIAMLCLFPIVVLLLLLFFLTYYEAINLIISLAIGSWSTYRRVNNYPLLP